MPRKTKDINIDSTDTKKSTKKSTTTTKTTNKATKKVTTKATSSSTTKKTSSVSKKSPVKSAKKKKATSNSSSSKKRSTKKQTASVLEYYDLPYRYNQTVVKILAQTPTMLFVYWDISDEDRKVYLEKYGENFFNETKPFLQVYNETKNYSFEVEINDFANSWYLKINDADCKYSISLCRKFNKPSITSSDTLYIANSNELETPNDHVLFEKFNPNITFKNVKNNSLSVKNFGSLTYIKNIQNIYDLYKNLYNENFEEFVTTSVLNPSSSSNL